MALTLKQRLQKAHISLMRSKEFCLLSGIIMLGKAEFADNMPTAATNGRDVWYGPEFVEQLNDKQFAFVVAHENFHKMYKHLIVWRRLKDLNQMVANMAMDYVINLQIRDLDPKSNVIEVIDGTLIDDKYKGMDVKQVFDLLMQDAEGQGSGAGSGDGHEASGTLDQHDWDGAGELTDAEMSELADNIDRAIRQGEAVSKRMGGTSARDIGAIPDPVVNWREQMRQFFTSVVSGGDLSTWSRPRRRMMAAGMYLPSSYSESIESIGVFVDTSGSVGDKEVAEALAEVAAIAKDLNPEKLHLVYWGSVIARTETYLRGEFDNLLATTRPTSGGGTTPQILVDWMKAEQVEPSVVVIISDGYVASWPEFGVPALWAMTTSVVAPNATTICISEE